MTKNIFQPEIKIYSPNFNSRNCPHPWPPETKIEIFLDRIKNWQFGAAKTLIQSKNPNHNIAILHLIIHYFEMIAKYRDGYTKDYKSRQYFKDGFSFLLTSLSNMNDELLDDNDPKTKIIKDKIMDDFYFSVRCGLYHAGIPKGNIAWSNDIPGPLIVQNLPKYYQIIINPTLLVNAIEADFDNYVSQLRDNRDNKNDDLRNKFLDRFSFDVGEPV
ncbi:MAG: hypothetical protein MUO64_12470 [Anaerolineales bacterium]|nr:hypothetical protein [Anaerolineales bacterium]